MDFRAVLHDASEAVKRVFGERLHLAENHEHLRAPSPMPTPPPTKIRPDKNDLWTTIIPFRLYFLNFLPPQKKTITTAATCRSPPFFSSSDGLSWSQDDPATALSDVWCSRRCVSLSDPTSGRWTSGKPETHQTKDSAKLFWSSSSASFFLGCTTKKWWIFWRGSKCVPKCGKWYWICLEGIFTAHFLWNCSEFTPHCGWKNVQRVSQTKPDGFFKIISQVGVEKQVFETTT